jgi:amino acid adenylation domain-containing protein
VGRGQRVAVLAERSPELVAAFLAILKAGGAYLPLDPAYPTERLAFMLEDAGAPLLLTDDPGRTGALERAVPILVLDPSWSAWADQPTSDPAPQATGEDLAYVMYTSGSTGTPKGVCIPQRAISRLVVNADYVALRADDVVAQASNASFDAATFEIWGALLCGARLVVVPRETLLAGDALAGAIEGQGITTLFLTTALFNELARLAPPALRRLRHLLFGGEAVDPRAVRRVLAEAPPGRLLHVYGPTETTTFATWQLVTAVPEGATTVPIGRPLANTTAYVLDPHRRAVPIGVPGELYLGGPGVALGYLDRPELTAEKFVPDPFSPEPSARLYRTGDLVRTRADGAIEFLGRLDQQVKLRGFRIELGEIEAALSSHPAVRDAVVAVHEDELGTRRLVAYVVPGREPLPVDDLRAALGARLPDYMVPAAFVALGALPLTVNGKLDRRALPAPSFARPDDGPRDDAPRTATEKILAGIWAQVLGLDEVGIHESFFDLGGDSILSMQVVARARNAGLDVHPTHLFTYDSIAELALVVEAVKPPEDAAPNEATSLVNLDQRQLSRILARVNGAKEPRQQ